MGRSGLIEKRQALVEKSKELVPNLDPELTAYGPIEGKELTQHPKVKWHYQRLKSYKLPKELLGRKEPIFLCLFPCSAVKPYYKSNSHRAFFRMLFDRLHYKEFSKGTFRDKNSILKIIVISEPLGAVPYEYVNPDDVCSQYDCPAFFTEVRNGRPLPNSKRTTPWRTGEEGWTEEDAEAWQAGINEIAGAVATLFERTKEDVYGYINLCKTDVHREIIKRASKDARVKIYEVLLSGNEWHEEIKLWREKIFRNMGRNDFIKYLKKDSKSKSKSEILGKLRGGKITFQKAIKIQAERSAQAYSRRSNLVYNNPIVANRLREIIDSVKNGRRD